MSPLASLARLPWARRSLLYGGAALIVWTGSRLGGRLEAEAAVALTEPPAHAVRASGRIGKDRLHDILTRGGADGRESWAVTQALDRVLKVRRLLPSDRWEVVRSTSGALLAFTVTRGLQRFVVAPGEGRYRSASRAVPVRTASRTASGTLKDNLWLSMQSAGVPAAVISEYADVFQWTVDFLTEPRAGDRFAVAWTERRGPNGELASATVETALYDGRVSERKVGVRFEGEYYDEKGESLKRMFLRAPLAFRRISSHFTTRRFHPVLRTYRPHHGIDYAAAHGTPVVAVAEGRVSEAGWKGGLGRMVEVRHSSVYTTTYGHLSRLASGVAPGARVSQGEVIGYVGSTGLATGPHLHFQIEKNGSLVNFLKLNLPFAKSVPKDKRDAFASLARTRLSELTGLTASAGTSQ